MGKYASDSVARSVTALTRRARNRAQFVTRQPSWIILATIITGYPLVMLGISAGDGALAEVECQSMSQIVCTTNVYLGVCHRPEKFTIVSDRRRGGVAFIGFYCNIIPILGDQPVPRLLRTWRKKPATLLLAGKRHRILTYGINGGSEVYICYIRIVYGLCAACWIEHIPGFARCYCIASVCKIYK